MMMMIKQGKWCPTGKTSCSGYLLRLLSLRPLEPLEDGPTGGQSKIASPPASIFLPPPSIHPSLSFFLPSSWRKPVSGVLLLLSTTARQPRGKRGHLVGYLVLCPSCFGFREAPSAQRIASVRPRCSPKRELEIEIGRRKDLFPMGNCLGGSPSYVNKVSSTAKPGEWVPLLVLALLFSPSTCPYAWFSSVLCSTNPLNSKQTSSSWSICLLLARNSASVFRQPKSRTRGLQQQACLVVISNESVTVHFNLIFPHHK
jgi:hypothetical protein